MLSYSMVSNFTRFTYIDIYHVCVALFCFQASFFERARLKDKNDGS